MKNLILILTVAFAGYAIDAFAEISFETPADLGPRRHMLTTEEEASKTDIDKIRQTADENLKRRPVFKNEESTGYQEFERQLRSLRYRVDEIEIEQGRQRTLLRNLNYGR
jgi:hypothetical protein